MDREDRRARNWPALAALWTLGGIWIAVAFLIGLEGVFDVEPPEAVAWILLGVGIVGFTFALAGVTLIRTRGEIAVALAALVLGVLLPSSAPLFFYGAFGFGWE